MSDIKNMHHELTPRLREMLAAYGVTPERDPESARRTQARFMAEVDSMFVGQTAPQIVSRRSIFSSWSSSLNRLTESLTRLFVKRSFRLVMTAFIILTIYLLGGVAITASAASSSLPGETLYPIKTTFEVVRANLTRDSAEQARLYLDFARRRLIEMQSLLVKGRYNHIDQAVSEYERDIQRALVAIEHLSQTDRIEAIALNTETAKSLRIYRQILTQMLVLTPQDKQPVIQSAIDVSQSGAGGSVDDDETASPTPTPTATATPAVLTPEPTQVSPTATPVSGGNNNGGSGDRNDDSGNGGGSGNDGSGANNAGDGDDDDGNGADQGGGDDDDGNDDESGDG